MLVTITATIVEISAASAYSYDMVSSRIIMTTASGAPTTQAATAAIPLIAKTVDGAKTDRKLKRCDITWPLAAPMKIAGEKTPPKIPNPMQSDVRKIFKPSNF